MIAKLARFTARTSGAVLCLLLGGCASHPPLPTVDKVCLRGDISTSCLMRATAASTLSRLCDGSPMPM